MEIPNIQKQRKHLAKLVLDMDSSRTRYSRATLLSFLHLRRNTDHLWVVGKKVCDYLHIDTPVWQALEVRAVSGATSSTHGGCGPVRRRELDRCAAIPDHLRQPGVT